MLTSGSRPNTSTLGTTTPSLRAERDAERHGQAPEPRQPPGERRTDGADPGVAPTDSQNPTDHTSSGSTSTSADHGDRQEPHGLPFAAGGVRRRRERRHRSGPQDRRFEPRQRHEPRDRGRPSRSSAAPDAAARGAARTPPGEIRRSARTRRSSATTRSPGSAAPCRAADHGRHRSPGRGTARPRAPASTTPRARSCREHDSKLAPRGHRHRHRPPSRARTPRRRAATRPAAPDRPPALAEFRSPRPIHRRATRRPDPAEPAPGTTPRTARRRRRRRAVCWARSAAGRRPGGTSRRTDPTGRASGRSRRDRIGSRRWSRAPPRASPSTTTATAGRRSLRPPDRPRAPARPRPTTPPTPSRRRCRPRRCRAPRRPDGLVHRRSFRAARRLERQDACAPPCRRRTMSPLWIRMPPRCHRVRRDRRPIRRPAAVS